MRIGDWLRVYPQSYGVQHKTVDSLGMRSGPSSPPISSPARVAHLTACSLPVRVAIAAARRLIQRRIVTSITDEELKLTNPRTPAGATLELVFKRAK